MTAERPLPVAVDPVDHLVGLSAASEELEWLRRQSAEFEAQSTATTTRRVYDADWRQFQAWCDRHGLRALPADPDTVRLYATDLAIQVTADGEPRFKVSSIRRYLAAIGRTHYDAGHGRDLIRHEAVSNLMAGVARARSERTHGRRPLLLDDVTNVLAAIEHGTWPGGVTAARDTLVILLGFASAMRRSEIAALRAGEVVFQPLDGLHIRVSRSKTDQEGAGQVLAVPFGSRPQTCVPCAWVRWNRVVSGWDHHGRSGAMSAVFAATEALDRHVCRGDLPTVDPEAPLLRRVDKAGALGDATARPITGSALNEILKRRLAAAGYDPTPYGFHSLRAGMVTQARRNGATGREVRRQTRHSSEAMVDVYDREHLPLEGNAVTKLGL